MFSEEPQHQNFVINLPNVKTPIWHGNKFKLKAVEKSKINDDWLPDLAASFVDSRNRKKDLPEKKKFQSQHNVGNLEPVLKERQFHTCKKGVTLKWQAPIKKIVKRIETTLSQEVSPNRDIYPNLSRRSSAVEIGGDIVHKSTTLPPKAYSLHKPNMLMNPEH